MTIVIGLPRAEFRKTRKDKGRKRLSRIGQKIGRGFDVVRKSDEAQVFGKNALKTVGGFGVAGATLGAIGGWYGGLNAVRNNLDTFKARYPNMSRQQMNLMAATSGALGGGAGAGIRVAKAAIPLSLTVGGIAYGAKKAQDLYRAVRSRNGRKGRRRG